MTSSALLYRQVSSLQTEDGLKLIDRLSPLEGSRVLDLGCGTGYLASVLAQRGSGEEFPNGPYDIVFANYVLHWIKDKESVFLKVFENLSVSGKFAFYCSGSVAQVALHLEALMKPEKPKINDYFHFRPPDVYETIASRGGFQAEFKLVESRKDNFTNIEALMEWMYASTSGKLDYHSIDETALHKFKKSFGDKPVSHEFNTIAYIFIKS